MSTDDSVSEDVSSSGALSHCHASADGDGGKESETSLVSSEGTSASGLVVSEDRHTTSQTTGGTEGGGPMDVTPACNKIRSLCLSSDEAFEQGKNLPFINPSSLETLRALVQEIQSSGETDPEIWKDCEGRWLHLFQLVEKQYQEQILAQQEQYQCQIQLIQDEIKALVQLQNRQAGVQPHTDFPPVIKTPTNRKDCVFPLRSADCTIPTKVASDDEARAASALNPFSSLSPPPQTPDANPGEERATTGLSSGYGTLSAWETGPEPTGSQEDDDSGPGREKLHWRSNYQMDAETNVIGCRTDLSMDRILVVEEPNPSSYQQRASGTSQPLTSWAQRQKLRPKKSKAGPASSQILEHQEQPHRGAEGSDCQDQQVAGPSAASFPLKRSDSLTSEASGLTYWRLNEAELYRPLPDSFDSGAYLLLQEASMSLTPSQEPRLSLREIYQNKQRTDCRRSDWDGSITSIPSSPQVLTLDPTVNQRQSDRTSGFTSPSHFSSPSFAAQPLLYPRVGTPVTPDSMVESGPHPGDTDCISDASSVSAAAPPPPSSSNVPSVWTVQSTSHDQPQQHRAAAPSASEEEGSHTHTSTLKPGSASCAANPHTESAATLDDPVVLSLLRQNLREKHSRHVADLKAYYESEIQILRDKLKLTDLPQDLEKSNQALTKRCKQLEKALAEATARVQELETTNSSLEKKLAEWSERYAVAGATVKSLQHRLDKSKSSGREKDALTARLKTQVRQLEESLQKTCRDADDKEARREREYNMLQDLLGEYDAVVKEHEELKNKLVSTENKLLDANEQISDLRRVVSKLESQVKQLEHENQARARHGAHSNTQPSGAGLFHHPDLLLSPSKRQAEPDVTQRKSPADHHVTSGRKSPFLQTNQPSALKKPPSPLNEQTAAAADSSQSASSWRSVSPPGQQEACQREAGRREASCSLTPMMRALIELEETRATQSRAPSKRETLLMPLSAKSSPKRCPTENFSTAFGQPLPREEHLLKRFDGQTDQRRHSFHSSSPRKRLQFLSGDRDDDLQQSESSGGVRPAEGAPQLGWEEQGACTGPLPQDCEDAAPLLDKLHSLAETEKLFDELTQEKLQIEAALSRMPGAGGRVSLQTRLDEVALENRLDRVNRELGSIRMTLKRFHVLRSSAHI